MDSEKEKIVKQIISEKLGVAYEAVTPNKHFASDLGADSLDFLELIMAYEDQFDIEISDDEAERIKTVKDAIEHLDSKI